MLCFKSRNYKGCFSGRPKDRPFFVVEGPPEFLGIGTTVRAPEQIKWIICGPYYDNHVAYALNKSMANRIAKLLNTSRAGGRHIDTIKNAG